MSIIYCTATHRFIDLDYEAEHLEECCECCEGEEVYKVAQEEKLR